jgi:hypothetical protein
MVWPLTRASRRPNGGRGRSAWAATRYGCSKEGSAYAQLKAMRTRGPRPAVYGRVGSGTGTGTGTGTGRGRDPQWSSRWEKTSSAPCGNGWQTMRCKSTYDTTR